MDNKKEIKCYLDSKNAQWFVYRENFNARKIEKYNIFCNWTFRESCEKLLRTNLSKEEFAEKLWHEIMYCFWSKCEYEITITSWRSKEAFNELKIDIADQIFMNYQSFIDYVWTYLRPIARQLKTKPTFSSKIANMDWRDN